MATLAEVKAAHAPARATPAAPARIAARDNRTPGNLPSGVYKGRANIYTQIIDGVECVKMGEVFSVGTKKPKVDAENGYDVGKVRSKRVHQALADVTFRIP